jgi:hypothetical protein
MTVNDVDLVTQLNANIIGFVTQPSLASSRLTFQHFNIHDVVTTALAPHNSDARQLDSDEWPPPLLFEVAYGNAALKTWGVPLFVNLIRGRTRDIYYNEGDDNDDENGDDVDDENGDGGDSGDESDNSVRRRLQQRRDHDARAARREEKRRVGWQASKAADSQAPDFFDIILALRMHNARKGQCQARAKKAEKTRENVQRWLDSTKD